MTEKFKTNIVMGGGGVHGIRHIGSLYALDKLGCLSQLKKFAGTSIGSFIIALIVIGYSPSELYEFIKIIDLSKLKNLSILNIALYGLDTGERLEYLLKRLIKAKGFSENITLIELFEKTQKTIIFTTVCVNTVKICYLSHETFPSLPLYLAVRMSTSLPIIYCPVLYEGMYYIDGGCLNTYPINVFQDELNNTFGILLKDSESEHCDIKDLETYSFKVLECVMKGLTYNISIGNEENTIEMVKNQMNIINYEISDSEIDEMFIEGYKSIIDNKNKIILT